MATRRPGRPAAALLCLIGLAGLVGLGRTSLLRVQGPSMRPTLHPGDLVLTVPLLPVAGDGPLEGWRYALRRWSVSPGTLVVLANPAAPSRRTIKRVTAIDPDGVHVVGDDPGWSIDSRVFGAVAHQDVRRRVLARLPRAPRAPRGRR